MKDEGNVVLGYTTDSHLMLDCDLKRESEVVEFSREYAKFHKLGSSLVMKTSEDGQVDLFGEELGNYCIVFGAVLNWDAIKWHVQEAYRLGIVNKAFTALRKFGFITIRINAKNDNIPYPKFVDYHTNGENKGVMNFVRYWADYRKLGRTKKEP